jgi:hypothetical protein
MDLQVRAATWFKGSNGGYDVMSRDLLSEISEQEKDLLLDLQVRERTL